MILGIDPGPEKSGWAEYDPVTRALEAGVETNEALLGRITRFKRWMMPGPPSMLAIELVASYGMPVGVTVFETCQWAGQFIHCWRPFPAKGLYRMDVKMALCKSPRAKDTNIRQAIIDRFGPGKAKAVGVKKDQGPLYGIKRDAWQALAVALTIADQLSAVAEPTERVRVAGGKA